MNGSTCKLLRRIPFLSLSVVPDLDVCCEQHCRTLAME